MPENVDLIVIGSGQGGTPLARDYARAGKHAVLFERGRLGGSCVNVGCTPSKAFLASAHNAGRARRAARLGIDADVRVDQRAVMQRVRRVRDEWHSSSETSVAAAKVDLIRATASFTADRTVAGGGREVTAPLVVIDTGTSPALPPVHGLTNTPFLTNETWFEQAILPPTLLVIGGGYIGLELGQGAARLGSSVTIVHGAQHVMEREEHDATTVVRESMERDGVTFVLGARVSSAAHDGTHFRLGLEDGRTLEAEGLLVATGRMPNTADLNVHLSHVDCRKGGYILVDDHLQTTCPGVYALGDVAGQPAFTHVSWEDYRRLTSTFAGTPRRRDDRVLSYTTFTEPQLARTGLSEAQAREQALDVRVETLPLSQTARGEEWDLTEGFYRLVVDRVSEKILGATLVGYEAGELVHTLAFGIELGATWRQLDALVGIHPTFGESLPSLARLFA